MNLNSNDPLINKGNCVLSTKPSTWAWYSICARLLHIQRRVFILKKISGGIGFQTDESTLLYCDMNANSIYNVAT